MEENNKYIRSPWNKKAPNIRSLNKATVDSLKILIKFNNKKEKEHKLPISVMRARAYVCKLQVTKDNKESSRTTFH